MTYVFTLLMGIILGAIVGKSIRLFNNAQVQGPPHVSERVTDLNYSVAQLRYQLGLLQKEGKRRMKASDIRHGLMAWREIDNMLFAETIERNDSLTKDAYPWCYAVGGPWGHVRLNLDNQTWWVKKK